MPPFPGDFIQAVVSPSQNNIPPTSKSLAGALATTFFSVELLDEQSTTLSLRRDTFANWEEIRTIKHSQQYHIELSTTLEKESHSYFQHQRLHIRSAIKLQLRCTEPSILLTNNEHVIEHEQVFLFRETVTITVPENCPIDTISFLLLYQEIGGTSLRPAAKLDVRLEGTYNPIDQSFLEKTKVELDTPLPDQTAILHIVDANFDQLILKGWSSHCEKFQVNETKWDTLKLAEFIEQNIPPEEVIYKLRRFSRSKVGNLIAWLKKLLKRYGKELCLVIADHTDMETPWEMLEVGDLEYLGARARVVRWTQVRCFDYWQTLKVYDVQKQGTVITYLDDEELGIKQTYRERKVLKQLKGKNCKGLQELKQRLQQLPPHHEVGLIYLGCHGYEGIAIGSQRERAKRITYLALEMPRIYPEPRPVVFINACESARLKRDGKEYFSGLLEVLLARFASGYIGTVGRVGSAYASGVAERILHNAYTTQDGIQIAEVLRQLRAEAVQQITEEELVGMDEAERQKREEQLLYAFMYVYYGNALARLRLLNSEETEHAYDF